MTPHEQWLADNPEWEDHDDLLIAPPSQDEISEEYPDTSADMLRIAMKFMWNRELAITRGSYYVFLRRRGRDTKTAEMYATQKCARGMTDDVFWSGRKHFSEVYGPRYASEVKSLLAARGVRMTAHDEYMPELAQYKGDPQAVVNRADGRTGIKRRCEKIGVSCDGAVNVRGRAPSEDPLSDAPALADDLIRENFQRFAESKPDEARRMTLRERREAMIEKHGTRGKQ